MENNSVKDVVELSPRIQRQLNVVPVEAPPELVEQLTNMGSSQAVVLDGASGKTLLIDNPAIRNMLPGNTKRYTTGHELVHAAQNLSGRSRATFQQDLSHPVVQEAYNTYHSISQYAAQKVAQADPTMRDKITKKAAQISKSPRQLSKFRDKSMEYMDNLFDEMAEPMASRLKDMSNAGLTQLKKMILNEIQAHTLTKNTFARGNQVLVINDVVTIQLNRKIYGLIKTEEYQRFLKAKALTPGSYQPYLFTQDRGPLARQ